MKLKDLVNNINNMPFTSKILDLDLDNISLEDIINEIEKESLPINKPIPIEVVQVEWWIDILDNKFGNLSTNLEYFDCTTSEYEEDYKNMDIDIDNDGGGYIQVVLIVKVSDYEKNKNKIDNRLKNKLLDLVLKCRNDIEKECLDIITNNKEYINNKFKMQLRERKLDKI